jgi:hypothetical protein
MSFFHGILLTTPQLFRLGDNVASGGLNLSVMNPPVSDRLARLPANNSGVDEQACW